VRAAGRNIERWNEEETVRSGGDSRHGRSCDRNYGGRSSSGRHQQQRGVGNFGWGFEYRGSDVFARRHGNRAYQVAAAGQYALAAKGHHVLTLLDEERLSRPEDLVAFPESAEGSDVFGKRVHRSVSVGAIAVESVKNGIVVDAIKKLVNGAKPAAEQREIQRAEGCVDKRGVDNGNIGLDERVRMLRFGFRGRRRLGGGVGPVSDPELLNAEHSTDEQN
jgi:hypothetical protein